MINVPLLAKQVLQPLIDRYGNTFWNDVCGECALRLKDKAEESVTWQDPTGYYILSETEESYGRLSDEGAKRVALRRKPAEVHQEPAPAVFTEPVQTAPAVTIQESNVSENTGTDEFNAETTSNPENAATTETPAETGPKPITNSTADLADRFPNGTLVEVTNKGSDWTGRQGEVKGVEAKRGVNYLQVFLTVSPKGIRYDERYQKTVLVRGTSVEKIDAFREAPAPKETVAETPATDENSTPAEQAADNETVDA